MDANHTELLSVSGRRLLHLRTTSGISLSLLAQRSLLPISLLSRWEGRGNNLLSLDICAKLAAALQVAVGELVPAPAGGVPRATTPERRGDIRRLRCEAVPGRQITRLRAVSGLTIAQLAHAANVHPGALKRWERGAYALPVEVRERLAEALGVDPKVLLWPCDARGDPLPEDHRPLPEAAQQSAPMAATLLTEGFASW